MSYEFVTSLSLFAFVSSITPGPNNLMLMASGANYGFKRTIPHLLGVSMGFVFMAVLLGMGLVNLFEAYPVTYQVLKVTAVVYLFYLAWKIANANTAQASQPTGKPFTFFQAVLFQWVNPKVWAMALTTISVYTHDRSMQSVLLVSVIFGAVNLPCVAVWATIGQQMARLLTNPKQLRLFNRIMAILLIISLYPVLIN
jgi:threonine/homoserine/homoserine lactone efflux protein